MVQPMAAEQLVIRAEKINQAGQGRTCSYQGQRQMDLLASNVSQATNRTGWCGANCGRRVMLCQHTEHR